MAIRFNCSQCGSQLEVDDVLAGQAVQCAHCSAAVMAPEPAFEAEAVDEDGYGMADTEPMPAGVEDEANKRPCPMCGEMIYQQAMKCRFCGEVFDASLRKQQVKDVDQDMSTGDWVVAILCSGIGCIAGIVWMIQGKPKGTKMFAISFGMQVVWSIVNVAIRQANQR